MYGFSVGRERSEIKLGNSRETRRETSREAQEGIVGFHDRFPLAVGSCIMCDAEIQEHSKDSIKQEQKKQHKYECMISIDTSIFWV